MVVAWEIRNSEGGLVTTCFKERDAIKAKEKYEAAGKSVKIEKVFDHHLKPRDPVAKKKKSAPVKERERKIPDLIPEGTRHIMVFVRPGDLITSELGIGVNHKGTVTDGITRLVISDHGKVVPIIVRKFEEVNNDTK